MRALSVAISSLTTVKPSDERHLRQKQPASIHTNRFSENVTGYDKNGNIKTLQRYGQTAASSYGLIDNLTFTLAGNQLSRVDDAAAASAYNGGFEFKGRCEAGERIRLTIPMEI